MITISGPKSEAGASGVSITMQGALPKPSAASASDFLPRYVRIALDCCADVLSARCPVFRSGGVAAIGGILIDETTFEAAKGTSRLKFDVLEPITVKGKSMPISIFRPVYVDPKVTPHVPTRVSCSRSRCVRPPTARILPF